MTGVPVAAWTLTQQKPRRCYQTKEDQGELSTLPSVCRGGSEEGGEV